MNRIKEIQVEALNNIEAEIRYSRLELRDIRVTNENPVVKSQFITFSFYNDSMTCLKFGEEPPPEWSQMTSAYWIRRPQIIPTVCKLMKEI